MVFFITLFFFVCVNLNNKKNLDTMNLNYDYWNGMFCVTWTNVKSHECKMKLKFWNQIKLAPTEKYYSDKRDIVHKTQVKEIEIEQGI